MKTLLSLGLPQLEQAHKVAFQDSLAIPTVIPVKIPPLTDQTGLPSQDAVHTSIAASAEGRSLTDWSKAIHQVWSRGADSTLVLARLMSQARQCLRYGSWSRLWQSGTLPFSKRKGDMLVVIGQGLGVLDAHHCAQLPRAMHTLYHLARLGQTTVEKLIEQGRIGPKLSLRQAKCLLREPPAESQPKNSCSKLKALLARLGGLIRADSGSWPEEQRKSVRRQILALANEIPEEKTTHGAVACEVPTGPFHGRPMEDKPSLDFIRPLQFNPHEHVGQHLSTV
jgi:hypothetical protein